MPTSVERHVERGFTLLEVMATVGLIGLVLLPILVVRESAQNRAYHSTHMMRAMHHAEELLAQRMREPTPPSSQEGWVEEDPVFRYELLLEDWDLATGRSEDENEDDPDWEPGVGTTPGDAGAGGVDADDRDNPHKVRRFAIEVFWPGLEEDEEDSIVIEGFVPRIWEENSYS